ncbi:MAG: hypothetical protein ABR583_14240 [Gaiellaceae bacterium]
MEQAAGLGAGALAAGVPPTADAGGSSEELSAGDRDSGAGYGSGADTGNSGFDTGGGGLWTWRAATWRPSNSARRGTSPRAL